MECSQKFNKYSVLYEDKFNKPQKNPIKNLAPLPLSEFDFKRENLIERNDRNILIKKHESDSLLSI